MKKLLPAVLSGALALSFSQLAAAQGVGVQGSAGTGASVDLDKKGDTSVQNNASSGSSDRRSWGDIRSDEKKSERAKEKSNKYGDKHKNKDKDHDASSGSSATGSSTSGDSKATTGGASANN